MASITQYCHRDGFQRERRGTRRATREGGRDSVHGSGMNGMGYVWVVESQAHGETQRLFVPSLSPVRGRLEKAPSFLFNLVETGGQHVMELRGAPHRFSAPTVVPPYSPPPPALPVRTGLLRLTPTLIPISRRASSMEDGNEQGTLDPSKLSLLVGGFNLSQT